MRWVPCCGDALTGSFKSPNEPLSGFLRKTQPRLGRVFPFWAGFRAPRAKWKELGKPLYALSCQKGSLVIVWDRQAGSPNTYPALWPVQGSLYMNGPVSRDELLIEGIAHNERYTKVSSSHTLLHPCFMMVTHLHYSELLCTLLVLWPVTLPPPTQSWKNTRYWILVLP